MIILRCITREFREGLTEAQGLRLFYVSPLILFSFEGWNVQCR